MSLNAFDSSGEETELTDWLEKDHTIDERAFYRGRHGERPMATVDDLKRSIPADERQEIVELDRYWVTYPYAYVSIAKSTRDNEYRYYVVEPEMTETEAGVLNFLTTKIQISIRHSDIGAIDQGGEAKRELIRDEYIELLQNYGLNDGQFLRESVESGLISPGPQIQQQGNGDDDGDDGVVTAVRENAVATILEVLSDQFVSETESADESADGEDGEPVSPSRNRTEWADTYGADTLCEYVLPTETPNGHPAVEAESTQGGVMGQFLEDTVLTDYQAIKLLYYLERDFVGFQRIDAVKHDINIEEISTPGYNQPVYVYHSEYDRISTNVVHGEEELDAFISRLAQVAGKEINHRNPQVDAILADGSRAQLTYKTEVAEHGGNYTIRQFREVPFTPVDLLCWGTFSLEQLAYMWLCVQYGRSFLLAGGTATGKTTALNALSLFISTGDKVVSIEDTREIEIPHRNWIAETTREAVGGNKEDAIDEYALLEAALRQRPDYLLMGEVRGEEGRDLFQVMSSGHTSFSTFHASSVGEVLKRFTTDPIDVPKPVFTTLDLVCTIGRQRIRGDTARRVNTISEIGTYQTETDQVTVKDIFKWRARGDQHIKEASSAVLADIREEQGWTQWELAEELLKREALLSYLVENDIRSYREVVVVIQAFINDQDAVLTLMANGLLSDVIRDLTGLKSIRIDTDDSIEQTINRPSASEGVRETAKQTLTAAKSELLDSYQSDDGRAGLDIGFGGEEVDDLAVRLGGNDYVGDTSMQLTTRHLSETTVEYIRQSGGSQSVETFSEDQLKEEEVVPLSSGSADASDDSNTGAMMPRDDGGKIGEGESQPTADSPQSEPTRGQATSPPENSSASDKQSASADTNRATDTAVRSLFAGERGADDNSTAEAPGEGPESGGSSEDEEQTDATMEAFGELFTESDEQLSVQRDVDDLEGYVFGDDS